MLLPKALRAIALAILLGSVLAGCGEHREEGGATTHRPVRSVEVVRVASAASEGSALTLPARVKAREEVTVRATIAGRVTSLPFAEGRRFEPGAVLARFDAPETRNAIAAARAGVESASLRLDLARKQEARVDSLHRQGVASTRDLEIVGSERRVAEAADAEARASEAALLVGVAVPAPFAGVVVRHSVDPGATLVPGQALLEIRSLDAGEILAAVPEGAVPRLRNARVAFQIGDGPWHPAVLARIDGMTDFTTRTRNAWFRPDSPGGRLDPGAFARIRIAPPSAPDTVALTSRVVTIPTRCLVRRGGLSGVFVVEDGRATLRWLRVGRADSLSTEVLAGLSPAEAVVLDPGDLADGQSVAAR